MKMYLCGIETGRGLVRLFNDDDDTTTGFRREWSAYDAVRFLWFMNESRWFVCLYVCLSAEKNENIPTVTLNHCRLYRGRSKKQRNVTVQWRR